MIINLYNLELKSLRFNIFVNQEITLFDDTIKNNIKYANFDATDDEILEAAKLSYCNDFIEKSPNKFIHLLEKMALDYLAVKTKIINCKSLLKK